MSEGSAISRRSLIAGAAVLGASAALGAGVARAGVAWADDGSPARESGGAQLGASSQGGAASVKQYGFLVDTERCVNCQSCVAACREANGTPENVESRRKVVQRENASGERIFVSTGCMHCEDPACMTVCPAGAISKGDGGVVVVDGDRCIGCKYCYQACPFGVPHYAEWGMDKCDCCLGNGVPLGSTPHCVSACKFRALHYGPLDELQAASGERAKHVQCSTGPSYLLM